MKFLNYFLMLLLAVALVVGCEDSSSDVDDETTPKTFDNLYDSSSDENEEDSGAGSLGDRDDGTIEDGVGSYSISGTPEITSLQAGYKRVVVTWNINTTMDDAALTIIYWNAGKSSYSRYIYVIEGNSITVEITDLAEGEYTFYAQNATPTSNKYSASSESITVYVYGEAYCKSLEQRTIASTEFIEGGEDGVGQRIDVTWGTAPSASGCIGSNLNYYTRAGDLTAKFCALSESVTELDDAFAGTDFNATTLYLIDDCVDTLFSAATDTESLPMGGGANLVSMP